MYIHDTVRIFLHVIVECVKEVFAFRRERDGVKNCARPRDKSRRVVARAEIRDALQHARISATTYQSCLIDCFMQIAFAQDSRCGMRPGPFPSKFHVTRRQNNEFSQRYPKRPTRKTHETLGTSENLSLTPKRKGAGKLQSSQRLYHRELLILLLKQKSFRVTVPMSRRLPCRCIHEPTSGS